MKIKALSAQFKDGNLRHYPHAAGIADKAKTAVDIKLLPPFFIQSRPFPVHILHRAPLETWQFKAKLHPMRMPGQSEVDIRITGPDLRIPMAWVVTHQDLEGIFFGPGISIAHFSIFRKPGLCTPVLDADNMFNGLNTQTKLSQGRESDRVQISTKNACEHRGY